MSKREFKSKVGSLVVSRELFDRFRDQRRRAGRTPAAWLTVLLDAGETIIQNERAARQALYQINQTKETVNEQE